MDFLELDERGRWALLYCPLSCLNEFDLCDFENYKHPPFMWSLWYLALIGKMAWDKIKELIGDEEGGEGDKKEKKKDEKKKEEKPKDEEAEEEPPQEEEEEEAPPPPPPDDEPAEEEPPAEEEEG